MRLSSASASLAFLLAVSAAQVLAQVAGDPVTYTDGGVVYTAVLDPDLDTVSDRPVSTVTAAQALVTTVDANGDPVTVSNGVTLGGGAAAITPATTTTQAGAGGGGVSNEKDDIVVVIDSDQHEVGGNGGPSPSELLHFQSFERRSPTPSPDQPHIQDLKRRQAALGGGGGVPTTQTGLQTISGYDPPGNTQVPEPSNYSSGSILVPSQIPGYTGKENSQGISSSGVRLNAGTLAMGSILGAMVFVLF